MTTPRAPDDIPLFPLHAVLFPGAELALRIFERRYLDMVRDCARAGSGFGVCLILEGREVGAPAIPAAVGTLARIVDFHAGDDGLLGIRVLGEQRFRVTRCRARDDGSLRGVVDWWPVEAPTEVPVEFALLQDILARLVEAMAPPWRAAPRSAYEDAGWLGFRLAELLPLGTGERQRLLELTDPLRRLAELRDMLPRFQQA
jgi:Lon protease-like protein